MITPLNFPKADVKLRRKDDVVYIWCVLRKKYLVLTPEEWVRQHTIHYLIQKKNISEGLISSEHSLSYNGLSKRADIVVFDRFKEPVLLVECKAPEVEITENTFQQIAQYNSQLGVNYLMLTNGMMHVYCHIHREKGRFEYIEELPNNLIVK
ncbi:MAG: type I restriction enzyme HsdR N-terminal domain-containing protein [Crocinitomicaceae bacterium]|nr:type I restriction enzyme HsdR N-terminal domain-containing protein [Crocinitomicaceae bacterium]